LTALVPVLAMIRKDLQMFLSDRRAVIMAFAMPIVIASFFGFIFQGRSADDEVAKIPILMVDQDGSTISKAILEGVKGDKNLSVRSLPIDEARENVRRGNDTVAVVIPPGFGDAAGRAFFRGTGKPQLDFLYDPSHAMELAMVRGVMTQHVMEAVSREMFSGQGSQSVIDDTLKQLDTPSGTTLPEERRTSLRELLKSVQKFNSLNQTTAGGPAGTSGAGGGSGFSMPFEMHEEPVTARQNATYNGFAHSFAGMGLQFMLFAAINMGIDILTERQKGIWKRLRSAPVSKLTLLGSKVASGSIIGSLVLLVSFAFSIVVWHVRIDGSWAGFLGVAMASAVMAASYGLLIAALGKTPSAARGASVLATLMMVMLGGAWVPTFIFPAWLQKVTVVVPTRWAVDGFDAMSWRGLGFASAVMPIAVLLGFALLFSGLAVWRFRWEE
jgi:ABC-2 type transport system permease protein